MSEAPAERAAPQSQSDEDEPRILTPFIRMDRGLGTVDPNDPNRIAFDDFSPRVLASETPDEVVENLEIVPIPKASSAPEPVSSSGTPPVTTPPVSETPVLPEPPLGPLPIPSSKDAEPGAGKPNQSEAG